MKGGERQREREGKEGEEMVPTKTNSGHILAR